MLPRVTVKKGLSFACPRCGEMCYRAANASDVFTAAPGHEVKKFRDTITIACPPRYQATDEMWFMFVWRVVFADVPRINRTHNR